MAETAYDMADEDECKNAKGKIAPFVGRFDKSADETGDDGDVAEEDGEDNGAVWKSAGQQQDGQQQRKGNEIVYFLVSQDAPETQIEATNQCSERRRSGACRPQPWDCCVGIRREWRSSRDWKPC